MTNRKADTTRNRKIPGEPGQLRVKDDQECCGRPDAMQKTKGEKRKKRRMEKGLHHRVSSGFGVTVTTTTHFMVQLHYISWEKGI